MSVGALGARSLSSATQRSASAVFYGLPLTTRYGEISDGYIRPSCVARTSAYCRNRFRPIQTFGNPGGFVGGPQNAGDSTTTQQAQGGGSLATSTRYSS